jgi:hypothetical protein
MKYFYIELLRKWLVTLNWKSLFYSFFYLTFSIGVFYCVLSIPIPLQITEFIGTGGQILALIVFLFFPVYFCFRLEGKSGKLISISVIFALAALPLRILWQNDNIAYAAVGGLLPWSDARGFYDDMLRFIQNYTIGSYTVNASRTIFVSTYAFLLILTKENLQLTVAIVAYVTGLSLYYLVKIMKRIWGALFATIVLFILFSYYRLETGILSSEPLGFAIGICALAFLLRNIHSQNIYLTALGMFLLTISAQIRPGAMFIIPVLIIWAVITFKDRFNKIIKAILLFLLPVLAGFFVGWLIPTLFGDQSGQSLSSVPYLVLSLVNGGTYPDTFFPLFSDITRAERNLALYDLAWKTFISNPVNVLYGILYYYKIYFSPEASGGFRFIFGASAFLTSLGFIVSTYGFGIAISKIRQPLYGFLVSGMLGFLISIPLSAYVGYRAYAASIFFLILMLGIGITWLFQPGYNNLGLNPKNNHGPLDNFNIAVLIIFGFICLSPFMVKIFSHPIAYSTKACAQGEKVIFTRISPGTYINVTENTEKSLSLPQVSKEKFSNSLTYNENQNFVNFFRRISTGTTVMNAYSINDRRLAWVVSKTAIFPGNADLFYACGSYSSYENSDSQIFIVKSWIKN